MEKVSSVLCITGAKAYITLSHVCKCSKESVTDHSTTVTCVSTCVSIEQLVAIRLPSGWLRHGCTEVNLQAFWDDVLKVACSVHVVQRPSLRLDCSNQSSIAKAVVALPHWPHAPEEAKETFTMQQQCKSALCKGSAHTHAHTPSRLALCVCLVGHGIWMVCVSVGKFGIGALTTLVV